MDQTKVTGYLAQKLGNQLANAQNAIQQEKLGKAVVNNQKLAQALERVESDRTHDKMEGVQQNPAIMDKVHISPAAQALYHAHEAKITSAPEKAHDRRVDDNTEVVLESKPTPET